jgi:protein required for attachment to host cells
MPPKKKITWLLVGDAAKAQLYSVSAIPLRLKKVPSGAFKVTKKMTEGPEHQPEARHTAHVKAPHGIHQRHENVFIERLAEAVDAAAGGGGFDNLVVVLPPKAMAHFRKIVSPGAQNKITREISGDWTKLKTPDMERHLAAHLP